MTGRVVVVGGGPAGLAAATVLAAGGRDVHVLEAGTYGGPRMCGEFLSPDATAALQELDMSDALDALDAPVIRSVRITLAHGGRRVREHGFRLEAPGRGIGRTDLDPLLADRARRAGAVVEERCRVSGVVAQGEGPVRIDATGGVREADAVVVANGRGAGPGRRAGHQRSGWVAVKVHVLGVDVRGRTDLHFVRGAYVGLNEVASRGARPVNVCALVRRKVWDAAGRSRDAVWEHLASESPAFAAQWRAARAVDGSRRAAAAFDFDVRGARGDGPRPPLWVGDAAALIAPLCGDGQAMALGGGVAAARELLRAPLCDAAAVRSAATRWERVFARSFRGRLRSGLLLQRTLLWPPAARALLSAARRVPQAGDWAFRATRGAFAIPSGG